MDFAAEMWAGTKYLGIFLALASHVKVLGKKMNKYVSIWTEW